MKKIASIITLSLGLLAFNAQAQTATTDSTKATVKVVAINLADYAGKYKMEGLPFEYIDISIKEEKLYIEAGGQEGFLEPVADKPETFDAEGKANLRFGRDESTKKVTKLFVEAMGMSFEGKRED